MDQSLLTADAYGNGKRRAPSPECSGKRKRRVTGGFFHRVHRKSGICTPEDLWRHPCSHGRNPRRIPSQGTFTGKARDAKPRCTLFRVSVQLSQSTVVTSTVRCTSSFSDWRLRQVILDFQCHSATGVKQHFLHAGSRCSWHRGEWH